MKKMAQETSPGVEKESVKRGEERGEGGDDSVEEKGGVGGWYSKL